MMRKGEGWSFAGEALEALRREGAGDGEVLLRRSRGSSVRVARNGPPEVGTWDEEGVAVRAVLADGRTSLATASSWSEAASVARRAVALAEESGRRVEAAPHSMRRCLARQSAIEVSREPPSLDALASRLGDVEAAALGSDERIVALDASQARSGVVESYLATPRGVAVHQRQATSLAHASIVVRDGLKAATRAEAWAGPELTSDEAHAFGERAARSALVHLTGSGAAPPVVKKLLLRPAALAEITFELGLALLGASPLEGPGSRVDPRLELVEDSREDAASRVVAADGLGRALETCAIVRHGAWLVPRPAAIPWVRPGLGDLPRPAWLRLTWRWRDGASDAELVARMGQGLLVESVHASSVEGVTGRVTGSASGWWVEDGRVKHAVAGVPFTMTIAQIVRGAVAGGERPVLSHHSGAIRAVALLVNLAEADDRDAASRAPRRW